MVLTLIVMIQSRWSDFFNLVFFKTFNNLVLNKKLLLTTFFRNKNYNYFLNLSPKIYSNRFRTLRRLEPIVDKSKENYFNKTTVEGLSQGKKLKQFFLFKVFLKANSTLGYTTFVPHTSQRAIFIRYGKKGVTFSSLPKLYASWSNMYNLLFNLIFYKVEMLIFSNSFFKNEVLALNWQNSNLLNSLWRYVRPFLTYQGLKINDFGNYVFRRLNEYGHSLALVLDIAYHNKTIYYLRRHKFYVIGIVPSNRNIKSVDFAFSIINDTIVNQLFFIRLILLIKKNIKLYKFEQLKSTWLNEKVE